MKEEIDKQEHYRKESVEYIIKNADMFQKEDYKRLSAHIEGHMYFLGNTRKKPVSWEQATYSWMRNVYEPVSQVMENTTTLLSFPDRRKADLFFELCDHLYYMSIQEQKEIDVYEAVLNYDSLYGKTLGKLLAKLLVMRRTA